MKKIYKFGGASIKNLKEINNVLSILKKEVFPDLVVVFSAMDKVTNMLERVVEAYFSGEDSNARLDAVKEFHYKLMHKMFDPSDSIFNKVNNIFVEIEWVLEEPNNNSYDYYYDQIVSTGELFSTKIMSAYLHKEGVENVWVDARDMIRTDNSYRNAKINWELTSSAVKEQITTKLTITQGFIGCTSENFTTTLGREGSDFTAAILAYSLDASEVVIWKDVPGVMNADPRFFKNTNQLMSIPYDEAIELAFYGAKVIHPKTIQPLQKKLIPLKVKSFLNPDSEGTIIHKECVMTPSIPSFIVKENQVLISISDSNLAFIVEEHLSNIFNLLSMHDISINMMQNSAVSFSICVDNDLFKIPQFIDKLRDTFQVFYNEDLRLYTIRNYTQNEVDKLLINRNLILEQKTRNTIQLVVK